MKKDTEYMQYVSENAELIRQIASFHAENKEEIIAKVERIDSSIEWYGYHENIDSDDIAMYKLIYSINDKIVQQQDAEEWERVIGLTRRTALGKLI